MRRLLASIIAGALLWIAPAQAFTPGQRQVVLNGVQGWSLPNSSADLYFSLNGGSCAINRIGIPCSSLISTSRASTGLAQWSDGHWSSFAANQPRITDQGVLIEQAATNLALYCRDMTQAAWIAVNMTAALTATGIDNSANSASTLTASAGNATILQTLTLASAAETYSVFLKRISGTGEIDITENGGTTWTPVVLTSAWQRFSVETTLANPVIGIRIVANGDAIAADFSQLEASTFATSPILTTNASATRAADIITLIGPAQMAALNAKAAFFQTYGVLGNTNNFLVWFGGASGGITRYISTTQININDGSANVNTTIGGSGTYSGVVKSAFGWDGSTATAIANGGTKASGALNFPGQQVSPVYLGNRSAVDRALNGYIQRAAFGNIKGQFDGLTAP